MPTFADYDKDEEDQGGAGSGSHGGGGGGAELAAPSPQKETGFVPWSRFVSANEDVANRNANALNTRVQGEVSGAKAGAANASKGFDSQVESNYDQNSLGTIPLSQRPAYNFGGGMGEFGKPAPQAQGSFGGFGSVNGGESIQQKAPPQRPAGLGVTTQAPAFGGLGQAAGAPAWGSDAKGPAAGVASRTLSQNAIQNGPQGAKDLESSMGPDAWAKLMGDTTKAQGDAGALGSETGVQALIQKQAGAPLAQNGAFDAALEYGQGRKAFGDTAQAGSGLLKGLSDANESSQNKWHSLMGDINETRRQRDATAQANATNAANSRPQQQAAPAAAAPPPKAAGDTSGWSTQEDEYFKGQVSGNGKNAADRNNGQVVQNFGSQDSGWDQGAFGMEAPSINVPINPKTKKPDYGAWWGGAEGPDVGDTSIDAATWYALAQMSPAARAQWWNHNHPKASS